jgi:hypothetical protein
MAQGDDPVDPDEILFRRIPASTGWYDPPSLAPEAFRPNKNDTTGLPYSARSTLQLKVLRREDQAKLISLQSSVQAI